jgi:hypothetical protein
MNLFENSWLFHADHGYVLLNNKAKHAGTCDLLLDYGTQADAPHPGRRAEGLGGHSHQYHDQSSFPQQHFVYDSVGPYFCSFFVEKNSMHASISSLASISNVPGLWRVVLLLPPSSDAWRWLGSMRRQGNGG